MRQCDGNGGGEKTATLTERILQKEVGDQLGKYRQYILVAVTLNNVLIYMSAECIDVHGYFTRC